MKTIPNHAILPNQILKGGDSVHYTESAAVIDKLYPDQRKIEVDCNPLEIIILKIID